MRQTENGTIWFVLVRSGRVEMWRGGDRNGEWPLTGGFRRVPVPQSVR